jgi:NADH:ubiquinone oxidoreductase subunit 6 (subunit J)
MLVVNFLFSLTLIFSCFIIFSRNAMMSKLSFILVVLIVCFLLTYLELEFIIFSYLLIYIGAICVLFLLVIKMLQMDYTSSKNI